MTTTFYSTPLYTSRCLYRRCGDRAIWRAGECPRPPRPLDNTDSAHAHSSKQPSFRVFVDGYLSSISCRNEDSGISDSGTMNYCSPETVGDHEGRGGIFAKN